jgi:hypothetical protein
MLVQLKTTENNLTETKQAHDKLITIAAKYHIDISRLKDYLKDGPDPLIKDAENQLNKATDQKRNLLQHN